MRTVVIVSMLALAGCLGEDAGPTDDPAGDDDAAPDTPFAPTGVALAGCAIVEAFALADEATVTPHLPSGFAVVSEAGFVRIILGAAACETSDRGFLAIPVTPTDPDLAAPAGHNVFYEPEHIVPEAALLVPVLDAAGAVWAPGNVSVTVTTVGMAATIDTANGSHHITPIAGAAPLGPLSWSAFPPFREYFAADGGFGYIDATYANPLIALNDLGVVMIETAPGTVANAILGDVAYGAAIGVFPADFAGATVGHIAFPHG